MLIRLILGFLLLLGLYLLLRKLSRTDTTEAPPPGSAEAPAGQADEGAAEMMVQCRHCGVHVPQRDVVFANGYTFCCTGHRDQYLQSSR